jgi:cell division protein ZapA
MAKQPVRVQIFNQNYSLMVDGDPRDVMEVAHQIDELMVSIANRVSSGDATRVAILACLHLADKLRSAEKQIQSFADESGRIGRIATMLEEALHET